jgi:rod shape determining protein RodA
MVAGIIPVVGMPLPFISKGGSSLLSFYLAFGIIISMATHKKLMQH